MPEKPSQELAVALAGPVINLVLAGLLWLGISLVGGTTDMRAATSFGGEFATQLLWINVMLALFNLIPAFPMDGGRALRALLALKMDRERATDIAATLGKGFAVLIVAVGAFYNPLLILIGVVVWLGASQERALVHLHAALHGVPVSAAMLTRVREVTPDDLLRHADAVTVAPSDPLDTVLDRLRERHASMAVVVDHGVPVGMITADALTSYAARHTHS
jgi:hypothetical protein